MFFIENQSFLIQVLTVSLLGLLIYLIHGFFLNKYLTTQNNIVLSIILPSVTLVITKAISTNFFLALGMIGALSIVRYRTPVKSGYELSLLFALITVGIVGGVNLRHAISLAIFVTLVSPIVYYSKKYLLKTSRKIFKSKGQEFEMTITTNQLNENLVKKVSEEIINIEDFVNQDNKKQTIITLKFDSMDEAKKLREEIVNETSVENISLSSKE
jgi:hypothetical protein|tara:strand:+ start:87 stop:728 length:642 start_codon:yes stop_codon:yes gene_type:complete